MLDLRKMAIRLVAMAIIICGINTPLCAYAATDDGEIILIAGEELFIEYANSDDYNCVTKDIKLPTVGYKNTDISWESDKDWIISPKGEVHRPSFSAGDEHVVLRATLERNGWTSDKTFHLDVMRKPITDWESVQIATEQIHIKYANSDYNKEVTKDIVLPSSGFNNTLVSWESSNERYIDVTGKVYRPNLLEGDMDVTVTANVYKNGLYDRKRFDLTVLKGVYANTDLEDVEEAIENLEIGYWYGDSPDHVTENLYLPSIGLNDTFVLWSSNNERYLDVSGHVSPPDYFSGDKHVTVTGTVYKNDTYRQKDFDLTIIKRPISDQDAVIYVRNNLQIGFSEGETSTHVTKNLFFQQSGDFDTSILWYPKNEKYDKYVNSYGEITRPDFFEGDVITTVVATVYKNGFSASKEFQFDLVKLPLTDLESANIAADNLNVEFSKSDYKNSIVNDLYFPTEGFNDTSISWSSFNTKYLSNTGKVTRPDFISGDQQVTVVASVYKNNTTVNKNFDFIIEKNPITDHESVQIATENLNIGFASSDYDNYVTQDVYLPSEGYNGTKIKWILPNYFCGLTPDGRVFRQYGYDSHVELTAVISKNGVVQHKKFNIIIRKW